MSKLFAFTSHKAGSPLKIVNKSAKEAEIILYAGIGQDFWGDGSMVSLKQFNDELKKIEDSVETLNIRINSPGGDVFDGVGIYNRILDWKRKKTTRSVKVFVDGWAASIASIIALAGDEIVMGEGALYMIHLPWTFAVGDRMALENTINRLSTVEEQMLGIYSKKSGLDREEVRALLEAETWMDADEAIEKGFVHSKVEDTMPIAASATTKPWLARVPKNYKSETDAVNAAKNDLKKKILGRIARK